MGAIVYPKVKTPKTLAAILAGVLVAVGAIAYSCSVEPKKQIVTETVPPTSTDTGTGTGTNTGTGTGTGTGPVTCGGAAVGATQTLACPTGEVGTHTQACGTDGNWTDTQNDCHVPPATKPDCSTVETFDKLAPVIANNCTRCHAGRDQLANAKPIIDDMITRIQLLPDDAKHMPQGAPSLSTSDISLFTKWKADGLLAPGDCQGSNPVPPQFQGFDSMEQTIFADINQLGPADQIVTRYLVGIDKVNFGTAADVTTAKLAASKAVNQVSGARQVLPVTPVAPGIWRINLTDLRLTAVQWKAVEDASQLQLESVTTTGVALKGVAQTRLPWMFVQDFNDTALRNATVYYKLTNAAATLQQFLLQQGVNFASDLANSKAYVLAFNASALSPAANRLIMRFDSANGACYLTEDTGAIVTALQNVFTNPEPDAAAGGKAILKFAAGEQLCTAPNGLMVSFLADAKGNRLNEADPNVVHDFTSNPVSPIIKNAISCSRCHNGGFIHANDEVRQALPQQNINPADAEIVLGLYKVQSLWDQKFQSDNAIFIAALQAMGIDPTQPDPISQVSDGFLGNLHAADVAGFLGFTIAQLNDCVNLSQVGRQQVGQVLNGGSVSHDQLIQAFAALKRDCRVLQNPL